MTNTTKTREYHNDSPVQIAKEARKAIRAAFPGIKFSLTGSTGTGYGWLHLSWTDGPTRDAMENIIEEFDARLGGYHHINSSRHYSPESEAWAVEENAKNPGLHDWDGEYFGTRRILAAATL